MLFKKQAFFYPLTRKVTNIYIYTNQSCTAKLHNSHRYFTTTVNKSVDEEVAFLQLTGTVLAQLCTLNLQEIEGLYILKCIEFVFREAFSDYIYIERRYHFELIWRKLSNSLYNNTILVLVRKSELRTNVGHHTSAIIFKTNVLALAMGNKNINEKYFNKENNINASKHLQHLIRSSLNISQEINMYGRYYSHQPDQVIVKHILPMLKEYILHCTNIVPTLMEQVHLTSSFRKNITRQNMLRHKTSTIYPAINITTNLTKQSKPINSQRRYTSLVGRQNFKTELTVNPGVNHIVKRFYPINNIIPQKMIIPVISHLAKSHGSLISLSTNHKYRIYLRLQQEYHMLNKKKPIISLHPPVYYMHPVKANPMYISAISGIWQSTKEFDQYVHKSEIVAKLLTKFAYNIICSVEK